VRRLQVLGQFEDNDRPGEVVMRVVAGPIPEDAVVTTIFSSLTGKSPPVMWLRA
jgi:hypothetical protein